jgi:hypothetical protein
LALAKDLLLPYGSASTLFHASNINVHVYL